MNIVIFLIFALFFNYTFGSPIQFDAVRENRAFLIQTNNRVGKILALYGQKIQENTAEAVVKLGNVVSSVSNVSSEINGLALSLNTSDTALINKLDEVKAAFSNGSDMLNALKSVENSLNNLVLSVSDPNQNGTLLFQLSALYDLLDTRLTEIEKVIGFNNTQTSGRSKLSFSSCSTDSDCSNGVTPYCNDGKCDVLCSSDEQCVRVNGPETVCDSSLLACVTRNAKLRNFIADLS